MRWEITSARRSAPARSADSGRRRARPNLASLSALAALLLFGCGGQQTRDCPAPIGRIVLEDCEVYRQRFEGLRVDLVAIVGQTRIDLAAQKRRLRPGAGPEQALEVLSHRLYSLCRDHNACRVEAARWRAERAALDETVTALTVIRDRLRAETDGPARAALLAELRRVLRGAAGTSEGRQRWLYRSSVPWFGAVHRPPQPDPPVGAPMLVGADLDTAARFAQGRGRVGYGPSGRFDLWWPAAAFAMDDALVVEWPGGVRSACPVRGPANGDDMRAVSCAAPETVVDDASRIELKLWYRTGIDGREHPLGTASAPLVSHRVDGPERPPNWDVDLDPDARRGELVWHPIDGALPATGDRPSLRVILKLRDHARPTARCRIGGEDAFGVLTPQRYSGQAGTHQDRPRYRKTGPNSSTSVRQPFIEWWRYDFPLPLGIARDGHGLPDELAPWPRAGAWVCTVTLDGEPVRRMRFTVKPDGQLVPHPDQLARPRAAWLIETAVLPSSVEEPL